MAEHDSIVSSDKLEAIADAIREKTGKNGLLTLDEMPEEIASISGGGETPECGVVPTSYASNGLVLSADIYGNIQFGALGSLGEEYYWDDYDQRIDPHIYDPENVDVYVSSTTSQSGAGSICYNYITSVTFNNEPTIIGATAFRNDYWLEITELPDTIEEIGEHAFENCYNLKITEIPESVTSIEYGAFTGTNIPSAINPYYDNTSKYSIGDVINNTGGYISYTCLVPINTPHDFDYTEWIEGDYPELVGVYDASQEYSNGTIVYNEDFRLVCTVCEVLIPDAYVGGKYAPGSLGEIQDTVSYHVGDTGFHDNYIYTCIADTTGYDSNWISGYFPEITGEYDPTRSYNVGDTVYYEGDVYTCKEPVSVPESFDYSKWWRDYCPNLLGAYQSGTTYHLGDTIWAHIESDGDYIFTCVVNSTSSEPDNQFNTDWYQGYYPEIIGKFDNSRAYNVGNTVLYNNSIYTCILATTQGENPYDSGHWCEYYYPAITGVYNSANDYNVGDAVWNLSSGSVATITQSSGMTQMCIPHYNPDCKECYDPTHTYNPGDVVACPSNVPPEPDDVGFYICTHNQPITGEYPGSSQYWTYFDDYKKFPLIFRCSSSAYIDSSAFSNCGYNIAFVPWQSEEGPSIEYIPMVIYGYVPPAT